MYYKVTIKDSGLIYRYIVLADSTSEARKFAREYHYEHVTFVDIEYISVSMAIIDAVI